MVDTLDKAPVRTYLSCREMHEIVPARKGGSLIWGNAVIVLGRVILRGKCQYLDIPPIIRSLEPHLPKGARPLERKSTIHF